MNFDGPQHDSHPVATEYLRELGALAIELQTAMRAIATNALHLLEESVWRQQALCTKLHTLAGLLNRERTDHLMAKRIHVAAQTVFDLNRRYEILVRHSARLTYLLSNLHNSYSGNTDSTLHPGISTRQTLSCEI